MPGWPFWAATSDERIDLAFDLAALSPGDRFVDLGCGDGRVLLRAAQERGALVAGVELDPALAAQARALLEDNGIAGTVIEADFADVFLEADVVFAYLSPATLQRLIPRLRQLGTGARVVTTGYAVPGWVATAEGGGCYLYRLPVAVHEVDRTRRGWDTPGLLVSLRPDVQTLVTAKLHHPGGPVVVRTGGGLAGVVATRAGADRAEAGDEVVVDLRFPALAEGTSLEGSLETVPPQPADGVPLRVFAVVDPGQPGVWGLNEPGCTDVATAMAGGRMTPVLDTARNLSQTREATRWPFWAATADDRIDLAFELAGLARGERLLDLGCGDGRVLLRAAVFRQAAVTGIEVDPELAATARELLATHGVEAEIIEADFSTAPLDADVVFAFLSTATLQRLAPRLAELPAGARVVTAAHPVPGWEPDAYAEGCWLYHLPPRTVPVDRSRRGWATPGLLISMRPDSRGLSTAKLHHPGGPVTVTVGDELTGVVRVRPGADTAPAGEEVAVDLEFEPLADGTLVTGRVVGPDGSLLRIFAASDAGRPGLWGLTESDCLKVEAAFAAGDPSPALEAARAYGAG